MIKENLVPDNVNSIDDLFEYLYGIRPIKNGTSAELLYYIISKIDNLNPSIEYHWNQKIKLYNNSNIQIDVLEKIKDRYLKIIDVKDWSNNVDRPEIQKLESTVCHIENENNIENIASSLVSTCGFTTGAKEWSKNSMTKSKINLYIMRLTEDIDIENKILGINLTINIVGPATLSDLIYSNEDKNHNYKILNKKEKFKISICSENIFLVNYKKTLKDKDLLKDLLSDCKWEGIKNGNSEQTIINEPIEINYNNNTFKASGMKFIREIIKENHKISKGKCFIALCDENNKLLKLFFEDELKKYKGEVLDLLQNKYQ